MRIFLLKKNSFINLYREKYKKKVFIHISFVYFILKIPKRRYEKVPVTLEYCLNSSCFESMAFRIT